MIDFLFIAWMYDPDHPMRHVINILGLVLWALLAYAIEYEGKPKNKTE